MKAGEPNNLTWAASSDDGERRKFDLKKKITFTLLAILIYRLGTAIPAPMIDSAAFSALVDRFGQLGQFLDIISGGAFKSVSVLALGISPYINASIIMQLLTFAIPALERLSKEGEVGQKIQKITRRDAGAFSRHGDIVRVDSADTTPGSRVVQPSDRHPEFAAGASLWSGSAAIDARCRQWPLIIFIGIAAGFRATPFLSQSLTVTKNIFLAIGLVSSGFVFSRSSGRLRSVRRGGFRVYKTRGRPQGSRRTEHISDQS